MNKNELTKNIHWSKYRWILMLLGAPIGLGLGFLYLHHQGIVVSMTIAVTSILFGLVVAIMTMGILYLLKRKLKLSGVNIEKVGDERADLIQQKAALMAVRCYFLLSILSPLFLFLDYKFSVYWQLIISINVLFVFFLGFTIYYSYKFK